MQSYLSVESEQNVSITKLAEVAEIKPKTSVPFILAPSAHKVPSVLALHNILTDEGGLS